MHRGYIKLWRKLRDSWLIKDPNALSLMIHLLINAEWQDGKTIFFKGKQIILKAGELTAGSHQLSEWTGQTRQMIREATKRLKTTNMITTKTTNRFTLFSIVNFNSYQGETTNQTTNSTTNKQPSNNQPTTTLEECKNISIKEKESPTSSDPSKQIDLKSIDLKGQSEGVKHKIFNRLVDTFRIRGWRDDVEYVQKVFAQIASEMNGHDPKEFFPYFKKVAENFINKNAEMFAADARVQRGKEKKLGLVCAGVAV